MPAVTKRISINESQIKKFTLRGGDVNGAVRRLSEATEAEAVRLSPSRTGQMASSIRAGHNWSNGRESRYTIRVGVSYAEVVLLGYSGWIYPNHQARVRTASPGKRRGTFSGRQPRLPVGKSQGEPMETWTFATRVRGQKANNFLMRAVRATMIRQGYR
jgi:hypothetical protein